MKQLITRWPEMFLALFGLIAIGLLRPGSRSWIGRNEPGFHERTLTSWVTQLGSAKTEEACKAISAIGLPAVPFLLKARGDDEILTSQTVAALRLLGPKVLPLLVTALQDPNPSVRLVSVRSIGSLAPFSNSSTALICPGVIRLLSDPSAEIRLAALIVLDRVGKLQTDAIPSLIRCLAPPRHRFDQDESAAFVHQKAAFMLGEMGMCAQSAVPALTRLLSDSNQATRYKAAIGLWQISHHRDLVLPELTQMLESSNLGTRQLAFQALTRIRCENGFDSGLADDIASILVRFSIAKSSPGSNFTTDWLRP